MTQLPLALSGKLFTTMKKALFHGHLRVFPFAQKSKRRANIRMALFPVQHFVNIDFLAFSRTGNVVILQAVRKNMYLSIIAGTVCYMALIRIM